MRLDEVSRLITRKLKDMAEEADPDLIQSRRKATSVLFPYAVYLAQHGQREMLDAFSRVARASDYGNFMWYRIRPFIMTLFNNPNPPSLNWVVGLISPHEFWQDQPHDNSTVSWPAVAPSYTGEANRSGVDEVLRVAADKVLRIAFIIPHGPESTEEAAEEAAVREVRALGDTRILRSYLLLLWSGDMYIGYRHEDFAEMEISIWESFGGIGMWLYREYLVERLDGYSRWVPTGLMEEEVEQCSKLKRMVLEVDEAADKILTRTFPWLIHSSLLI